MKIGIDQPRPHRSEVPLWKPSSPSKTSAGGSAHTSVPSLKASLPAPFLPPLVRLPALLAVEDQPPKLIKALEDPNYSSPVSGNRRLTWRRKLATSGNLRKPYSAESKTARRAIWNRSQICEISVFAMKYSCDCLMLQS